MPEPWEMQWDQAPAASPTFIPPNPVVAQRAAEEEERRRRDQAIQEQAAAQAAAEHARNMTKPVVDAPAGYRFKGDGSLEPIPGGPQDKPAPSASDPAAKLRSTIDQLDSVAFDSADNSGWWETGATGSVMRGVPGTAAYGLAADLKTIDANAAFNALAEMRASSPTGGALGQVTERELDLLRSTIANLDPNQSQGDFLGNVAQAKKTYLDMLRRLDPAAADEYNSLPGIRWDKNGQPHLYKKAGEDNREPIDPFGVYAGQQPPAAPPAGGSPGGGGFGGQLMASTQNALAGAAQGVAGLYDFPMSVGNAVERGVNYAVGQGGGALMDAVGLDSAADWWRQGSQGVEQNLSSRKSVGDLIEQASPTPEGMGASRFTSQLLGGAMVPLGPKAAPPRPVAPRPNLSVPPNVARDIIDEGARNNVRVMTSDVRPPTTFLGRVGRAGGERIPIAGTGGPRAAQQAERVEAVKELAREFGVDASTDLLEEVANDLSATRGGRVAALARQKNAVIDGNLQMFTAADAPRTISAIEQQITRLAGINEEKFAPVIRELSNLRNAVTEGKMLPQIEGNRKLLGALFDDPNLATIKGDGQKAINAIYGPLREDMGAFIKRTSGPEAFTRWSSANNQLSRLAGELDDRVFSGVLRSADTTPENVARILFGKKPSEVRRLVGSLSPQGRAKAQGAIIFRAIEKAGGIDELSPDKFASEVTRLGNSAGVVFQGADLARVMGLQRLLKATRQASVASAAPPTGAQNMPLLMGASVPMTGGGSAVVLGLAGGAARVYESAAVRNLLVGLGRTKPGTPTERRLLERIGKITASQMQLRSGDLANDNAATFSSAVAQDPERR